LAKGDDAPQSAEAKAPRTKRAAAKAPTSVNAAPTTGTAKLDWDRVRALRNRVLAGETLSPEDKAYYDKGVAAWPSRK